MNMRNPCKACTYAHMDKNNPTCRDCNDRVSYVRHIQNPHHEAAAPPRKEQIQAAPAAKREEPKAVSKRAPKESTGHRTEEKFCPKCRTAKSVKPGEEEFYKNRSRPDGFSDWCKVCHKESMNKKKTRQPAAKKKTAGSAAKAKPTAASKKESSSAKSSDQRPATAKTTAGTGKNTDQSSDRKTDTGTGHNTASTISMKTCTGCEDQKPADLKHFNRSTRSSDELDSLCKECRNLKKRQVRQMNKFTLSIDLSGHPDVYDRIKRIAEQEERTMEAQVRYWLKTENFQAEQVL